MSASCLDEVREKIRSLNSNKLEVKEWGGKYECDWLVCLSYL
jgi:hypothetical protein